MMKRRPLTVAEAYSRAAALCDKCEQCSPDIIKKLAAWGISEADIERIISELKKRRYLDDMRYARAYAHDKMAYSGWGRNKIIQGLWMKRLDREYIDASCDELDSEEYHDMALRVIKAKIRTLPEGVSTYESRMKVMRFAVQRGFEAHLVSGIISSLQKAGDEE